MSQVTDVNILMESDEDKNIFAFVSNNINTTIQHTKKENFFFTVKTQFYRGSQLDKVSR